MNVDQVHLLSFFNERVSKDRLEGDPEILNARWIGPSWINDGAILADAPSMEKRQVTFTAKTSRHAFGIDKVAIFKGELGGIGEALFHCPTRNVRRQRRGREMTAKRNDESMAYSCTTTITLPL